MTLKQFYCGLRGHDDIPIFTPALMALKCCSCQYQSPGWPLYVAPKYSPRVIRFQRRLRKAGA